MATPNPIVQIKAAIISNFTSQMNNTGTNPNGRLPFVKAVGSSWIDSIDLWPYVGITPLEERVERNVALKNDMIATWAISTTVRSAISTEDAYNQLLTVLDDGTSKGVHAILDDYSNLFLGGLVYKSQRIKTQYFDDLAKDKVSGTNQFAAYAISTFETYTRIVKF